jgi:hypothetical protein
MSFLKFLEGIGDRLGILESVSTPGDLPAGIQTRTLTLKELACEIRSREVRVLAENPAEGSVSFEEIFKSAGIPPCPKGWNVEKLEHLVSGEALKTRTREEIQRVILEQMKSEGVPVETVVKDAMARDQALDAFETVADAKVQAQMEQRRRRIQEIESTLKALREESAALNEKLKTEEDKWREWKKRKRALEREMASALSYIVDHSVITMEDMAE